MDDKQFGLKNLPAGASYYNEERDIVYYRGDSTNTSIMLPDGKAVSSITPALDYSIYDREDGVRFVVFSTAVQIGTMAEIVLKDDKD